MIAAIDGPQLMACRPILQSIEGYETVGYHMFLGATHNSVRLHFSNNDLFSVLTITTILHIEQLYITMN